MIPIVQHKFSPPRLPGNLLEREALLLRLEEGLHPEKRLTLVSGGAGFGKTTLLAQYARRGDRPVLWYVLDESDRDPMIFFLHLMEGLSRLFPGLSPQAREVLNTLGPAGIPQAMGVLCDDLDALGSAPFVLVLDDMHFFPGDRKAIAALEVLIKYCPDQAQLILSGRALPPVRIAHYKVKSHVLSIDESALRLSPEELMGLTAQPLSPDALHQIHERTRGWITGILYALSEPGNESLAHPEALYEFFAQEIFDDLPSERQDQLLGCAHLPTLSPETCRQLFGADFMAFLSAHQPFVSQEGDRFHFHPIFLDFLRHELQARWPQDRRREHFRRLAENWADTHEDRLEFLLLAEDWLTAESTLLETVPELLDSRRYASLQAQLGRFPASWAQASPWLRYAQGELARCQGELEASIEALERADALAQAKGWQGDRGRIWASLAAAWGARGEAGRQHDYVMRALEVLPADHSRTLAFCQNVLGIYHLYRHELEPAQQAFERALGLYREQDDPAGQSRALHNLALTYAKGGDFERSLAFYQESIRRAEAGQQIALPLSYNNMAAAHLYLGRFDEAQAIAEQGLVRAERLDAKRDRVFLLWTFGALNLRRGNPTIARDYFESSLEESSRLGDRYAESQALLGLAELAMRTGEARQAQFMLDRALGIKGFPLMHPEMIDAAMLQAELTLRNASFEEAAALLTRLAEHVSQGNHYRSFLLDRLWYEWHVAQGDRAMAGRFLDQMKARSERFGYPLSMEPAAPELEVACLGAFEARVDGRTLTAKDWQSGKAKLLLVYLMCHPSGASKDEILDLLYPEASATRSAVHVVVTRLRRALDPDSGKTERTRFILFENGRYRFDRQVRYRFDLEDFKTRLRQAAEPSLPDTERFTLLESAVRIYQGPFLEAFADTLWVQLEQENLRQAVQGAYETLFRLATRQERWHDLERLAEASQRLDPCCEAAFRAKMIALSMLDRRNEAKRVGAMAHRLLMKELAVAPEPLTRQLMASLEQDTLNAQSARSFFHGG